MIRSFGNCSTGTVPFGEISYRDCGRFLNEISLNSIIIFDFASASLARIA